MVAAAPSTRTWLVVALALFALLVAALGFSQMSRAHRDDANEVRRVVRTYEVSLMTGDGETACAQLTAPARRELLAAARTAGMGSTCVAVSAAMERYVTSLISQAPSPKRAAEARQLIARPAVKVVKIDGDSATARIEGVSNHPVPLTRTRDGWKISGLRLPGSDFRAG